MDDRASLQNAMQCFIDVQDALATLEPKMASDHALCNVWSTLLKTRQCILERLVGEKLVRFAGGREALTQACVGQDVYVLRQDMTLQPISVHMDFDTAVRACNAHGEAFVDRFQPEVARREPGAFDTVYSCVRHFDRDDRV